VADLNVRDERRLAGRQHHESPLSFSASGRGAAAVVLNGYAYSPTDFDLRRACRGAQSEVKEDRAVNQIGRLIPSRIRVN